MALHHSDLYFGHPITFSDLSPPSFINKDLCEYFGPHPDHQDNLPFSRFFITSAKSFCSMAQMVKNLPAVQETQTRFLGRGDALEKWMVTHSSILTWRTRRHRSPAGYSPGVTKESDVTEQLTLLFSIRSKVLGITTKASLGGISIPIW